MVIARAVARNFRYFNLVVVVDMLGVLPKIAHIHPLPARRAFHVVVGLYPSDAVDVPIRFRHLRRL